jgi:hypothetical protein
MRQKLSLQNIMVQLRQRWGSLPDARMPNNNMKYAIVEGVLSAFAVFFMQCFDKLNNHRVRFWRINVSYRAKKGEIMRAAYFKLKSCPVTNKYGT